MILTVYSIEKTPTAASGMWLLPLFGSDEVIPMWVADMDFPAAQPVVDALKKRAEHAFYGYTRPDKSHRCSGRPYAAEIQLENSTGMGGIYSGRDSCASLAVRTLPIPEMKLSFNRRLLPVFSRSDQQRMPDSQ